MTIRLSVAEASCRRYLLMDAMVTIRNAREEDVRQLADIGFRAWEKATISIGEMAGMRDSAREAFLNFAQSSWLTVTVVEQNGVLSGWAARENLDELITDFWIEPQHQRQGLGSKLLQDVERQVREQGFDLVRAETHAQNLEAVGFFEKSGYAVNWLSVTYSPKIDRDIQSVGMSKQLLSDLPDIYGPSF